MLAAPLPPVSRAGGGGALTPEMRGFVRAAFGPLLRANPNPNPDPNPNPNPNPDPDLEDVTANPTNPTLILSVL